MNQQFSFWAKRRAWGSLVLLFFLSSCTKNPLEFEITVPFDEGDADQASFSGKIFSASHQEVGKEKFVLRTHQGDVIELSGEPEQRQLMEQVQQRPVKVTGLYRKQNARQPQHLRVTEIEVTARSKPVGTANPANAVGSSADPCDLEIPPKGSLCAWKTLFVVGSFQNAGNNLSESQVLQKMEQVNTVIREGNYDRFELRGAMNPGQRVDVAFASLDLQMNDLDGSIPLAYQKVQDALAGQGIPWAEYRFVQIHLPSIDQPGAAGLGFVGGTTSISQSFLTRTLAHEIGHNIGWHHASSGNQGCYVGSGDPVGDCGYIEYGEVGALMGANGVEPIGVQIEKTGFMDVSNVTEFDYTSEKTYSIRDYGSATSDLQLVKMVHFYGPFQSDYYTITRDVNEIKVHYLKGSRAIILDSLSPGEIFEDTLRGVRISALSPMGTVRVTPIDPTGCASDQLPEFELNVLSDQTTNGKSAYYSLSINNQSACRLEGELTLNQAGWIVEHDPIVVFPGKQKEILVRVEPRLAAEGTIPFSMRIQGVSLPQGSVSLDTELTINEYFPCESADHSYDATSETCEMDLSARVPVSGRSRYRFSGDSWQEMMDSDWPSGTYSGTGFHLRKGPNGYEYSRDYLEFDTRPLSSVLEVVSLSVELQVLSWSETFIQEDEIGFGLIKSDHFFSSLSSFLDVHEVQPELISSVLSPPELSAGGVYQLELTDLSAIKIEGITKFAVSVLPVITQQEPEEMQSQSNRSIWYTTGEDSRKLKVTYLNPDRLLADCNSNSIPDSYDLAAGTAVDVDQNQIPDECDQNGTPTVEPPQNILATDGSFSDRIQITWEASSASPGADLSYHLYRAVSPVACQTGTMIQSGIQSLSYLDTQVTPGQTYFYSLKTVLDSTMSVCSSVDSGFAALPTEITQFSASDGTSTEHILLQWLAPPQGLDSVTIYKNRNLGLACDPQDLLISSFSGSQFFDNRTRPGVTYYYSIKGVIGGVETSCTPIDSGFRAKKDPVDPIPQPTGIVASDGQFSDRITVSMQVSSSTDSINYQLYRDTRPGSGCAAADLYQSNLTEPLFVDTSISVGRRYFYSFRVSHPSGWSSCSAVDVGFAKKQLGTCPSGQDNLDGTCTAVIEASHHGDALHRLTNATWDSVHDAAQSEYVFNGIRSYVAVESFRYANTGYQISRAFSQFDWSIPNNAEILSAKLRFHVYQSTVITGGAGANPQLWILPSTHSVPVVPDDYASTCGSSTDSPISESEALGITDFQSISQSAPNDVLLDQSKLVSAVGSDGLKLCMRTEQDVYDYAPTSSMGPKIYIENENSLRPMQVIIHYRF